MWDILRQRNFCLLWSGQIISKLGDWFTAVALPFYVYQHTHSALATGAMAMVQTLPPVILGAFAGVWVDRWDYQKTMLITDLLRAAVSLFYVAAALTGWLWIAYLAAMFQALLALFFDPARKAVLPSLLSSAELTPANNLFSAGSDAASLVGPLFGGWLVLKIGLGGAASIDALTYLVSAILIVQMRIPARPRIIHSQRRFEFWHEWSAGLRIFKPGSILYRLFITILIAMLGQGIINVLWIIYVNQVLQGSSVEYGVVQVAVALGGIMGAFISTRVGKGLPLSRVTGLSGMLVGLALLFTFLIPRLTIILGLQIICGIAAVGFFITQQTIIQLCAPKELLGRVFGAYQMTNAVAILIGEGLGSLLGGVFGTVWMLCLAALLYFFAGFYALLMIK